MEDPKDHCFHMSSGNALLGDLHGVSRSVECEFLSVLSYPKFLLECVCTVSSFVRDIFYAESVIKHQPTSH